MCIRLTGELQECFEKFGKVRHVRIVTVSTWWSSTGWILLMSAQVT